MLNVLLCQELIRFCRLQEGLWVQMQAQVSGSDLIRTMIHILKNYHLITHFLRDKYHLEKIKHLKLKCTYNIKLPLDQQKGQSWFSFLKSYFSTAPNYWVNQVFWCLNSFKPPSYPGKLPHVREIKMDTFPFDPFPFLDLCS